MLRDSKMKEKQEDSFRPKENLMSQWENELRDSTKPQRRKIKHVKNLAVCFEMRLGGGRKLN